MSNSKVANNPFAQAIFDCRDILLPQPDGKGGQRRRSDLRNILFTIASQGEYSQVHGKSKNGLWWTQEHLVTHTGIGRDQLRNHIDWLVSIGIVERQRRMNSSTILWINLETLHQITERQRDDRESYRAQNERLLNANLVDENEKFPEFDPEDLEALYFPPQEVNSEALEEAQAEALSEALPEAHSEAIPDPWAEAQTKAHAEAKGKDT